LQFFRVGELRGVELSAVATVSALRNVASLLKCRVLDFSHSSPLPGIIHAVSEEDVLSFHLKTSKVGVNLVNCRELRRKGGSSKNSVAVAWPVVQGESG
jgi:hypothetical protein